MLDCCVKSEGNTRMTKKDNIAKHLDDIDFRTREERQKDALPTMLEWRGHLHAAIKKNGLNERLEGQLTMLTSVLWLLMPAKEFDALKQGKIYIDQTLLTPAQKELFMSMQAFNGSPYCDKMDDVSVVGSYIVRMNEVGKQHMAKLVHKHKELAYNIANNIVIKAEGLK